MHDIALFQIKYGSKMNWNKVLDIAKRMKVVKYLHFVFYYINKMYGEIFDDEFLNILLCNASYSAMDNTDTQRSGLGKLVWLLDIYVDYYKDITLKQFVLGELSPRFDLINVAIQDQSSLYRLKYGEVKEITESYEFPLVINDKTNKVDSRIELTIDSRVFSVNYIVNNKKACTYENKDDECYKKDSIELIIIKKHCIEHRMFTISHIHDQYAIVMYSNNTENVIDLSNTEIKYHLDTKINVA